MFTNEWTESKLLKMMKTKQQSCIKKVKLPGKPICLRETVPFTHEVNIYEKNNIAVSWNSWKEFRGISVKRLKFHDVFKGVNNMLMLSMRSTKFLCLSLKFVFTLFGAVSFHVHYVIWSLDSLTIIYYFVSKDNDIFLYFTGRLNVLYFKLD